MLQYVVKTTVTRLIRTHGYIIGTGRLGYAHNNIVVRDPNGRETVRRLRKQYNIILQTSCT